jgi:hypothetical protein
MTGRTKRSDLGVYGLLLTAAVVVLLFITLSALMGLL